MLVAARQVEASDRVKDYIFSVTGVVLAQDGTALQDAEVMLDVRGPVYDGVTRVKTARHTTNSAGGFVFMYTSHERGVKCSFRRPDYSKSFRQPSIRPITSAMILLSESRREPGRPAPPASCFPIRTTSGYAVFSAHDSNDTHIVPLLYK